MFNITILESKCLDSEVGTRKKTNDAEDAGMSVMEYVSISVNYSDPC